MTFITSERAFLGIMNILIRHSVVVCVATVAVRSHPQLSELLRGVFLAGTSRDSVPPWALGRVSGTWLIRALLWWHSLGV